MYEYQYNKQIKLKSKVKWNTKQKYLDKVRNEFYVKPDKEQVRKQIYGIVFQDKVLMNKIYAYYFEEIANNTVVTKRSVVSINDAIADDALLSNILNKTKKYFGNRSISNVKTTFRMFGGFAGKPSNFPIKEGKLNLDKYLHKAGVPVDKKVTYIDTSCGWGARLLVAAACDVDYVGFEVNSLLIKQLNKLGKEIQKIKPDFNFKIYGQGSQDYVPGLKNKASIMMTSPPYFNLEIYTQEDTQSYTNQSYRKWRKEFLKPTIENSYAYLKAGHYMLFNIKSYTDKKGNYIDLEEKSIKYAKACGFRVKKPSSLKNIGRIIGRKEKNKRQINTDEKVLVFYKPER